MATAVTPSPLLENPAGARWLLGLRATLALTLIAVALFGGHFPHPLGMSDLLCAALTLAVSATAYRHPSRRIALLPIALWLGTSPFAFDLEGAGDVSWLTEVLVAKTLLISAVANPAWWKD